MIHEKRFYLKVRKANTNWGCSCCQPVGRDLTTKRARKILAKVIRSRKRQEQKLVSLIEDSSE